MYRTFFWNRIGLLFAFLFLLNNSVRADEIAVVVGTGSKVVQLTHDEVVEIFRGKVGNFPNGDVAVPLNLSENDPSRTQFDKEILDASPAQLHAYWARLVFTGRAIPPHEIIGVLELKKLLARNPNLIGYLPVSSVDNTVRIVFPVSQH